jgi:hypothetical protein
MSDTPRTDAVDDALPLYIYRYKAIFDLARNLELENTELHLAICQAVALLNLSFDAARCSNAREAHDLLRQALVDYADTAMEKKP